MALKEDGSVWTWGNNVFGQLGDGSSTNRYKPIPVKNLQNIKTIACRSGFSYALNDKGILYGWGRNGYASGDILQEAGRRTFSDGYDVDHPIKLNVPITASAITCSYNQLCAYEAHNNIAAVFMDGSYLVNYMEKINITPNNVALRSVLPCDKGWLALDEYGQVWYKKDANSGSAKIDGLSNIISIAGDSHYAALAADGTVWMWGNNTSGQLGDGTQISRQRPQKINGITDVKQIAAAGSWTIALKKDGTVWTWGLNGVLESKEKDEVNKGDMVRVVRRTPGVMSAATDNRKVVASPAQISGLANINSIAAGIYHCLAIKDDGTVWAWGYNDFGELGDGTTINREKPVMIKNFNVLVPVIKAKLP